MPARPPASPAETSPLHLHGGFRGTDLDEIRSVASAAQHPLQVDAPTRGSSLRFHIDHHPLSSIALTRAALEHDGSLRVWAPPLRNHYYIQVPLRGTSTVRHGSREATAAPGRTAVLLSPGSETGMASHGGFDEITLEIDRGAVESAWEALTGEPPRSSIVFDPTLRLDAEPGASVVRLTRFLVDEASRPTSMLTGGVVQERLEEALILCLLQVQPHSESPRLRRYPATARASLVSDAEAWMEARAGEPVSMVDVARSQGVTLRTLQRAFEYHRAYTPRDFLRQMRLQRAHVRLQRGDVASVTRIAMELGFRHLGRFSGSYRSRYGESPSATLRRARRRVTTFGSDVANRMADAKPPLLQSPAGLRSQRCGFCVG